MFNVNAIVSALNQIRDAIQNCFPHYVPAEVPAGLINGANTVFTLANIPKTGTLQLYLNGAFQTGGGVDYTLSGLTITFVSAPLTGSGLIGFYYY